MQLHEKIKALRKKKGVSQQELAQVIGVHLTHVSRLENGHYMPSLDVLIKLTKYFDVSADYLINNEEENYEVEIKDKTIEERIRLIDKMDEDERQALLKVIDVMLTKTRISELLNKKEVNA